jgi:hypothetical protein
MAQKCLFNPTHWIGAYVEFSKEARLYPKDSQRGHIARRYLAQLVAVARIDVDIYDRTNIGRRGQSGLESA